MYFSRQQMVCNEPDYMGFTKPAIGKRPNRTSVLVLRIEWLYWVTLGKALP